MQRHTEFLLSIESGELVKIRTSLKREKHLRVFHSTNTFFDSLHRRFTHDNRQDAVYNKFLNSLNCSHRNKESGDTALLVACAMGDIAVVHYLLLKGADPNLANKRNQTPILIASYFGHHNIVEHLAHLGGDIHQQESEDGNTALMIAIQQKRWKTAMSLIDLGAKVNTHNNDGADPLIEAAKSDEGVPLMEILVRKGADTRKHNRAGRTALMEAVAYENVAAVQFLLEHEARVDSKARDGINALMLAAASPGSILMLKLLLKYGANLDSREVHGNTALSLAIQKNRVANAQCLLEYGADTTKRNRERKFAEDYITTEEMKEMFDNYANRSPSRVKPRKVAIPISPYTNNSPKNTSSTSRSGPLRAFSTDSTNSNNSYSSCATYMSDDDGIFVSEPSPFQKEARNELFSSSAKHTTKNVH